MIVSPFTCACDASKGELPKSKPCGARPPTSPMQSWPIPAARNAKASSTLPTTMILAAPRASATAAVVNALKTSMMTTAPLALLAPDSRLSMLISIASLLAVTHTLWSDKCTNLECWRERPALNKDDSSVGAQASFERCCKAILGPTPVLEHLSRRRTFLHRVRLVPSQLANYAGVPAILSVVPP